MNAEVIQTNARPARFSVGLTGGIGSGKTSVANAFAERGASIIDTDLIAHELTAPKGHATAAIASAFGPDVIAPDGSMNRARMRERVFSDPGQKNLLESILHPMIRAEVNKQAQAAQGAYLMIVVPLLAETGHWKFSRILVIDCDEAQQIERVMRRDRLPLNIIQSIIAQQATREERLAMATDVLHNQADFSALLPEIDRLHKIYSDLSSSNPIEYL